MRCAYHRAIVNKTHHSKIPGAAVRVQALRRVYGSRAVLDGLDLEIAPGEIIALLGPSGCGKTTLLKILAGLEQPSAGEVWMDDTCVATARHSVPPEQRGLGMVFQDYALWPHLSVQGNVGFPLRMRGVARKEEAERVAQALELVGLQGMGERAPASLSGGQQQRVALARAIVARPQLLLFDEPLSNLDRDLRESLCAEMGSLLRELGCTAVYVTHDHEEACALADRVAVVMDGRFHQLDAPQALWSAPRTRQVAQFLKLGTLLDAQWHGSHWHVAGAQWAPTAAAGAQALAAVSSHGQLLLPHGALALGSAEQADHLPVQGRVLSQQYRCGQFDTWIDADWGQPVRVHSSERLSAGSLVPLRLEMNRLQWFATAA